MVLLLVEKGADQINMERKVSCVTGAKKFNTTGVCIPKLHYMVDTSDIIDQIVDEFIENDEYFTINRAHQFGKTTTLELLYQKLKEKYVVLDISFESADDCFVSLYTLAQGFTNKVAGTLDNNSLPEGLIQLWKKPISKELPFDSLSVKITEFCKCCDREVILMVDEVDKNSDNQIFISFLGLLREKYLKQRMGKDHTFKSVILAGVYDIKNLKLKLHPEEESKYNSPWNIAADFDVDMSFSVTGIAGMLEEYERDHQTGMNIQAIAEQIFEYTSGYPFLVSYICKKIDEEIAGTKAFPSRFDAWTKEGVLEAIKLLIKGPNPLYDDMIKHVVEYSDLYEMLNNILFEGQEYAYYEYDKSVNIGKMFGFIAEQNGMVAVANRIFETQLYGFFLTEGLKKNNRQREALPEKNQFVKDGTLDMDLVMEKFYEYYTSLYSEKDDRFLEKYGRKIFLMYLKPIINGTGNFYVEDQSRTRKRSDIIVDYLGKQYVIECKIWHGDEYNRRGEGQLADYMEAYHVEKGYLLSFNFNKKKNAGVKRISYNGKELLEVVV